MDRPEIGPGRLHSHAVMSEQLADLVDSIRNFEPILELLRRKGLVTLDHVCEGAQAFVAACAVLGMIVPDLVGSSARMFGARKIFSTVF